MFENRQKLFVFSDARFSNLSGGASRLGYIIFMHDDARNSAPLAWASKKARKVTRSTLTPETLAALEAIDAAQVKKKNL